MSRSNVLSFLRWCSLSVPIVILSLGFWFHSTVPEPPARPLQRKKTHSISPMSDKGEIESVSAPDVDVLVPASSTEEVAQAMDQTELRYQLQRLKAAAASGDATTVGSIQESLRRYGQSSEVVIGEELHQEADPLIREVLVSTRSLLR